IAAMTAVFGNDVAKTFPTSAASTGMIRSAKDVPIAETDPKQHTIVHATLADVVSDGPLEWKQTYYPSSATSRRNFQKRFQRALADRIPVVLVWYVDFNALDDEGRFFAPPTAPGRQGGHMVVMEDYQIHNVPGFGDLLAGTLETRPEALTAALDDNA